MHIMKGERFMKILKITNGKGEYSLDGIEYKLIDEITKEDVFRILELVIKDNEITLDEPTDASKINNLAQNIVYSNLLTKLKEVIARKDDIINESKRDFADAIEKYSKK